MNIENLLKQKIIEAVNKIGLAVQEDDVVLEHPKDETRGDYATNVALQHCKKLNLKPRDFASKIVEELDHKGIEKIEIAGPGFLNFFLKPETLQSIVEDVISKNENYGRGSRKGKKINVEFVSANPTGDLHLGHARCAAIGDSICRLYAFAGYDITREFYVNDAGVQVEKMGASLRARYLNELGLDAKVPEDGYHSLDLVDIAKELITKYGNKLIADNEANEKIFIQEGIRLELEKIKRDLNLFRVSFDLYSFESDVRKDGKVEKTLEEYKEFTYVDNGATFLKTSDFLDDKDRPVVKSDGSYTYLMPDITYHLQKLSHGYDLLVDVLGADHHGYTNRMRSALMMKGYPAEIIDFELVQVVRLMKGDVEVKMSKRGGTTVTLRELVEEVGVDATRYFFVARAATSHLDFDYDLALDQSSSNPVYYAQYAHARLCKLLETGADIGLDISASRLSETSEINLLKHLQEFPNTIESCAKSREPYKVATYIQKLASLTHAFYTECRVIDRDNLLLSQSRLALVKASQIVMRNALNVLGVNAPEQM
ncbi:MAG: arginine--tRNA ligase [Bacilli bacterium]|jgi:arginyl-tRNA synthetase|nr:arginine--tRNA ligase [Bacilli bacterium]MDD4005637.1 arginine--tRNA ligase [Bacilli bacterium]